MLMIIQGTNCSKGLKMSKIKISLVQIIFGLLLLFLIINMLGCLATTNYYTGRTLEKGKMMISFGMDNILIQSADQGLQVNKDMPVSPSLGLAGGLPHRFEAGLRWYFQKTFEGSFRWQINPRNFQYFDLSTNLHYGSFHLEANYFKYGFTLSKKIRRFEPFISHYWYANGDVGKLSDEDFSDILKTNRVLCFGMAVKVKEGFIIPEINYQYIAGDFGKALVLYSLGFKFDFKLK